MKLLHLHLRNPIEYAYSLRLQDAVLERHFAQSRTLLQQQTSRDPGRLNTPSRQHQTQTHTQAHPPTLLTFQTHPTYTVGRRHLKVNPLSLSQINYLTARQPADYPDLQRERKYELNEQEGLATFYASPRGGLLTYHAPGQLTAYLIYNLRYHGITPRCHIRLLENAVIRTCAQHGVPDTLTTEDPGVWVGQKVKVESKRLDESRASTGAAASSLDTVVATNRKICAIGVHVSRGISSHGIGLNVADVPPSASVAHWYQLPSSHEAFSPSGKSVTFSEQQLDRKPNSTPSSGCGQSPAEGRVAPGYLSWGFSRIIACGLEGKSVTWLAKEQSDCSTSSTPDIQGVADTLAREVEQGLTTAGAVPLQGVVSVSVKDVLP